ncbi:hypothetical protein ACLOJK_037929 [Asimina triloba]
MIAAFDAESQTDKKTKKDFFFGSRYSDSFANEIPLSAAFSSPASSSSFTAAAACSSSQRRLVLCCCSQGTGRGERKIRALMESTMKEIRDGASVLDMDPGATVGGGVEDPYGEDCATEDQLVTPWTISVAR